MHINVPVTYPLSPVRLSGAVATLIGLLILISWHLHVEAILQLRPGYSAMAYRTAIGMAFSGLALLLVGYRCYRLARTTAWIVAGVSLLSFISIAFSVDLGIDRLLADPYVLDEPAASSGIAPQTAIGLTMACLAIALAASREPRRHRSFLLATIGSLVIAIGVVALAGYLTGFEQAYGWGRYTRMSVQTAAGFLALGSGVFALGWNEARAGALRTPRWLFAPIVIGVATISILFCQALLSYENRQIERAVDAEAAAVQQEVQSELVASVKTVERTALRWETGGRPEQERWQTSIGLTFDGTSLLQAIEWVDPFYRAQWVVPAADNARDIGSNVREITELRDTLALARSQRQTIVSPPFDRGRGDLEIAVARAIYVDGTFDGFIIGIFRVNDLFAAVLNEHVSPASSVAIYDGSRHIFTRDIGDDDKGKAWQVERPAVVENAAWTLHVWPSNVDPYRSILPYGALVIGFVVAGLLGLVTWLMQQAGERAWAIQQANDSLYVEIVERRRAEEELQQSTMALERSNRSLQEFAYVASHDLKAPLVSLQGLATMLKADAGDRLDGDARLYLDRIVVNATKMRNLLDDLLELSRVGREDTPASAVDLGEVIDGVTSQLRQTLDECGGQVVVSGPLPVVAANPVRLHQVFANLIDNALKYTPKERLPRIEIEAAEAGDLWRVFVRDNGAGIPAEHRDKIFTMFQRLPKGRAMNPTGTGMGLAIVSRIVEANGGNCWIADSDEQGTTFVLTFPKAGAAQLSDTPRTPLPTGVA